MRAMTKNILEWGWHTSTPNSSSSNTEWKPAPTLLGGDDQETKVAAIGDLKCEGGECQSGGSKGATAYLRIFGPPVCRECGVKSLGIEGLSGKEQDKILKKFEIK